jgi:kynurenine 3-monooxygenase
MEDRTSSLCPPPPRPEVTPGRLGAPGQQPKISIIGAGMSGLLMAIYLHRRGYRVDVYERRPDLRRQVSEQSRSINMTLSQRGIEALLEVGLGPRIEPIITPLRGRVIHAPEGTMFQPYGKNDFEILHGVKRSRLNVALIETVEELPNVTMHFEEQLLSIDKQRNILTFRNLRTGVQHDVPSDVTIGADGTFSAVRQQMFRRERGDFHQECLSWGYKELDIPFGPGGTHSLRRDGLHIWARDHCMLIGTANDDDSFTLTCFMPFEGRTSFSSLRSEEQVREFFSAQVQDLAPVIPSMVRSYLRNSAETLVTTRCAPWHYRGRIVLIGDACHSVYPFYGQGMNAALEDCRVLDQCISQHEANWEAAFRAFQTARRRHTDALAELSKQNFIELREKVKSRRFVARKKIDVLLNRLFPELWVPLYSLVAHTTMPYADAVERVDRQNRRARLLGLDVLIGLLAAGLALKESSGALKARLAGRGKSPPPASRPAAPGVVSPLPPPGVGMPSWDGALHVAPEPEVVGADALGKG